MIRLLKKFIFCICVSQIPWCGASHIAWASSNPSNQPLISLSCVEILPQAVRDPTLKYHVPLDKLSISINSLDRQPLFVYVLLWPLLFITLAPLMLLRWTWVRVKMDEARRESIEYRSGMWWSKAYVIRAAPCWCMILVSSHYHLLLN